MQKTNPGRGAVAAPIVIDVPPELKRLAKPLLALLAGAAKLVKAGRWGQAIDYAAVAREVAAIAVVTNAIAKWGVADRFQFDRGSAFDGHAFRNGLAALGDDPHPLHVDAARPKAIDLTGRARKPDQWQPGWIVEKYFGK